jgi:DNA-binding CsgD family transcriptional regulator
LLPILNTNVGVAARDSIEILLAARQAIVDQARRRPLILGVDDAHFLDEASALLVFQLVSGTDPVSVVMTVREGQRAPEPITALWKERLAERIRLEPLSRAEVKRLLEAGLGGGVTGYLAQQGWEASAANLLYLQELVEAARRSGRLVQDRGLWRLEGRLETSERLTELIRARLDDEDSSTRAVLEVAAVGEPLDLATFQRVVDGEITEVCVQRGLLSLDQRAEGPVVRLAHPLYGEALRAEMSESRRMSITETLADALEATGAGRGAGLLRFVTWRLDVGGSVPPELSLQAARRALEARDLLLAERLAKASVAARGGFRGRVFLAGVHYRQGRDEDALADLDVIEPKGDCETTEVAVLRASVLLWNLGRPGEAQAVLASTGELVADPHCHSWLAAMQAHIAYAGGRPGEAIAIAGPVVDEPGLPPRPLQSALSAIAPALALSGRGDEALEIAKRGFDPALRAADELSGSVNWAVGTFFLAQLACGRLDKAEKIGRVQYEAALRLRNREAHGGGATTLGWVALLRGKVSSAAMLFREAEPHLASADRFGVRVSCLGGLAYALALSDDHAGAAAVLERAEEDAQSGLSSFNASIEIAWAWTLSIRDRSAAIRLCMAVAEEAKGRGQLTDAIWAYHDATRLGAADKAAVALAEVAAACQGPFPTIAAAHADALANGDRAGLVEAADRFEALGMLLLAAEAVAEAVRAGRDRTKDRPLVARARALAASCEGARTPPLAEIVPPPGELTPREAEVATLASEGCSSRLIAAQLGISARTVDSHLARAYVKLGVASRDKLAGTLGRGG